MYKNAESILNIRSSARYDWICDRFGRFLTMISVDLCRNMRPLLTNLWSPTPHNGTSLGATAAAAVQHVLQLLRMHCWFPVAGQE
jgi:hypothetical protein